MNNAVDYIKENVDFEMVLNHYNAKHMQQNASQIRCCCPIHNGHNQTAFVYNIHRKLWFCHTGCKTGGDVFDFVMKMESVEFAQSVNKIASIFNIDISAMEVKARAESTMKDIKNWLNAMRRMLEVEELHEYDIKQLGELYTINSYRNYTQETLEHFNVSYSQIYSRIVIPIMFKQMLIGVTMRRTKQEEAKWKHYPKHIQTSNILFNYDNIDTSKPLILVEGAFDVFNLWQYGFTNVVAIMGSHMSKQQEALILKASYNLLLAFDMDKAGKACTNNVIERLQNKCQIRIANIPNTKDIGELTQDETNNAINNYLTLRKWRALC